MSGIKRPTTVNVSQNVKLTTPKGKAEWAKVFTPDTKYVATGEYSVIVVLTEAESVDIRKVIDAEVEKKHAEVTEELKTKGKFKPVDKAYPYTEEYDSNGNKTGNLKFKFKMKAEVQLKDGTKFNQKPVIFDALGNPDSYTKEIWNGSLIRASGEVVHYYTASVGAGVTLRLKAVQIINLASKTSSGAVANAFGFGKEEGYVATQTETFEENFSEESVEEIAVAPTPVYKKPVLAFTGKPKVVVQATPEEDDFFGDSDNPF